jgi:hypothetical protein
MVHNNSAPSNAAATNVIPIFPTSWSSGVNL